MATNARICEAADNDEHPMDGPLGEIHWCSILADYRGHHDIATALANAYEAIQAYLLAEAPDEAVPAIQERGNDAQKQR